MLEKPGYVGRFAPSPTGPLHAGSLVAALASWLDARAHGGKWLVRIEDTDSARCKAAYTEQILQQLADLGLHPDAPPLHQSGRSSRYQAAMDRLVQSSLAYPCGCSRLKGQVYPGTCRAGLQGKAVRAWRLNVLEAENSGFSASNVLLNQQIRAREAINLIADSGTVLIDWHDRRIGPQQQDVLGAVGDFVLKRADGCWAYQLAVVVDDAAQGITHVVRGADLADNTARQIVLQRALGLPAMQYLHTPLVLDSRGAKLSKHNHAPALATGNPQAVLAALHTAGEVLGLALPAANGPLPWSRDAWLMEATRQWQARWPAWAGR